MFRVAAGTGMTPEILSEYIGKHKQEVIKRYQKLHDAYVNDYEIFHHGHHEWVLYWDSD